jgi:hypothetical protein
MSKNKNKKYINPKDFEKVLISDIDSEKNCRRCNKKMFFAEREVSELGLCSDCLKRVGLKKDNKRF